MALAFIGGTGREGLGLAMRLAKAGEEVIIGSRSLERAAEAAAKVLAQAPGALVRGAENAEAARQADIVFLTVPPTAHQEALRELSAAVGDKVVVDVAVPVVYQPGGEVSLIAMEEGSLAEQAQRLLPRARVVSAFHHLDAALLMRLDRRIDADVIVCGDDQQAKTAVMALAEKIDGVRALDGGPLANSRHVEAFTAVLLSLNRRYKARSAIRIVGI